MTLTKWNTRPRNHFPNWVDEFFNPSIWDTKSTQQPSVNVLEKDNSFMLELSSPGMKKDNFNLEIEDGSLIVSGKSEQSVEDNEEGKFLRREFAYQSFERKFLLPEDIDADQIKANYEDGILKVEIPKKEPESPKKKVIQIG